MTTSIPLWAIRFFTIAFFAVAATCINICAQQPEKSRHEIVEVTLDKKLVYQWCDLKYVASRDSECSKDAAKINVSATTKDQDYNRLSFIYKISGGQIIGKGPSVTWDLTKQRPGKYTIDVTVKDGKQTKGKSRIQTIELQQCPVCDQGCECPSLDVSASRKSVTVGEMVTFNALVTRGFDVSFNWKVSGGKIVFKAADEIKVQATRDMIGKTLTATVNISGTDPGCNCVTSASESVNVTAQPPNLPPTIESLKLSQTEFFLPCRPGVRSFHHTCHDADLLADVSVTAIDPENAVLSYNYTVTGGKIIGEGSRVKWDLTDLRPGTYLITAQADDGCGACGKTVTKSVTVAVCPDCFDECLSCPQISVVESAGSLKAGGTYTFTANIQGGNQESVTYNWTVSTGEIVGGQGTPSLDVKVPTKSSKKQLTVTLEIGGIDPNCNCLTTATKTVNIANHN